MITDWFVGNVHFHATDDELREVFAPLGSIENCRVVRDRETGRSRGYAFVSLIVHGDAEAARARIDGVEVRGRALRVQPSRTRGGRGD